MAQYTYFNVNKYAYVFDPTTGLKMRQGNRNGIYVIDEALTTIGFSGIENTDWVNISNIQFVSSKIRVGVRSLKYVIDATITDIGFNGYEFIDWLKIGGEDHVSIYFVSNDGDDTNNGLTPSSPWKTIAKINSTPFTANSYILFKRGDLWRETLKPITGGKISKPIIFSAYGSGNNPIITGSSEISGFAEVNGLWEVSSAGSPAFLIVNGVRGSLKLSKETCINAGDYFWEADVLTVNYPTDPSGLVEKPVNNYVIDIAFANTVFSYLELNGSILRGILLSQNNIKIYKCEIRLIGATIGYGILLSGNVDSTIISHNLIEDIICFGIGNINNPTNTVIEHNEINDCWNKLNYGSGGEGAGIYATSNAIVRYNKVLRCYRGIEFGGYDALCNHNIVVNSMFNGIKHTGATSGHPNKIYNNTIIHDPTGLGYALSVQSITSADNCIIKNNLIYVNELYSLCDGIWIDKNSYTNIDIDYNLVFKHLTANCNIYKINISAYGTLSEWQNALSAINYGGCELHSKNEDPLFVDFNLGNYKLAINSPCRNAGVDVGLIFLGDSPNIGAL